MGVKGMLEDEKSLHFQRKMQASKNKCVKTLLFVCCLSIINGQGLLKEGKKNSPEPSPELCEIE